MENEFITILSRLVNSAIIIIIIIIVINTIITIIISIITINIIMRLLFNMVRWRKSRWRSPAGRQPRVFGRSNFFGGGGVWCTKHWLMVQMTHLDKAVILVSNFIIWVLLAASPTVVLGLNPLWNESVPVIKV